ncbi:carbohydrate-binding protein [Dyadobacter luticola]|uniref:Carbohydrate-binding protein n=1 Tax=Dyadobacter luticola TaxID=1979387 RepID=A0A5R9KWN3_9BACT|nr:carbohydrate-binding protein [Dyadobacter luticola]TLV00696.1 carbohydrate-binding protein [Dyadobacter luticola]
MKNILLSLLILVSFNCLAQTYRSAIGKFEAESFDSKLNVSTETCLDTDGGLDVGGMVDNSFLSYRFETFEAGYFTFKIRVANGFSDNASLQLVRAADLTVLTQVAVPRTGGMQSWTTITMLAKLPKGKQTLRLTAEHGIFSINWFEISRSTTALPGKVEAELFDMSRTVRIENSATASAGNVVADIDDADWLDYSVNVATAGTYTFYFHVSNAWGNGIIEIQNDYGPVLNQVNVPRTGGWQNYVTVSTTAVLTAGSHVIRFNARQGAFNLDWFEATRSAPLITKKIPGKIEAEDFDGVSEIQTENTGDIDGVLNVGSIEDGDWMDYHVKVTTAGVHTFQFRVASPNGNCKLEIKNAAGTVLGQISIPWTGGWQSYQTLTTTATLTAGNQVLRLYANKGYFNINWFDVQFGNNIPKPKPTITFAALSPKSAPAPDFVLTATSTSTEAPITFTSSNTAVITVSNATGTWKAKVIGEGTANITASQAASASFAAADNVTQTQLVHTSAPSAISAKITLDPKRWYQLTNATQSLEGLFDGNTQVNVNTGWGKVLNEYEAYYPLLPGEQIMIDGIKFFDYEGSATDNPMSLSIINANWERVQIATFKGYQYNTWVGPNPDSQASDDSQFALSSPVSNFRYLVLKVQGVLPTEMEFYGSYTPPTQAFSPVPQKSARLGDMFGVNGYEWNFELGNNPGQVNEPMMNMAKSFGGFRHYMDWQKLEPEEGVYTYNPTIYGGWNYDAIYERCKAENIEVLACLKTLPTWMLDSYPAGEQDNENVPVRFGKDFTDPLSYIEQAKMGFQYAARYGSNTNVDPALLSTHSTPRWNGDVPNSVKIGLNLVKYIECDNERDKWWKGRKAYQTAREYAANLSAFYDGHKNTMGAGIGIKNADPNMKVVIAGLVTGPDYIKGMVDWCKQYRGYKADGSVNLCWDIVNFHLYVDNATLNQSGTSTRGAAPEVTNAKQIVDDFMKTSHEVSQDMPVWITETGYDVNQGSPLKAIPIGNKSELITQADWVLRTSLFSARAGIEKVFFYQMYDDNTGSGMFGTSGLLNADQTRRPAADYINQVNKQFGDYRYKETIYADPIVDRYELNGKSLFVLTVPDEIGRTGEYTLDLGENGVAKIYTPTAGSTTMAVQDMPITDGKVTVTASETPIFVVAAPATNARTAAVASAAPALPIVESLHADVKVYPNPTSDFISIDLANERFGNIEIKVFDAGSGRLHSKTNLDKKDNKFSHKLNISNLPASMYIVEITQDEQHAFRKVAKLN